MKKQYIISKYGKSGRIKRYFIRILLIIVLVCAIKADLSAIELNLNGYQGVIVLDPGHGGYAKGVCGAEGTLEKTVTMALARMIASELGDKYKTILTRNDDYRLNIIDRTAVANHLKADLFISIHTGGSIIHEAGGMAVFYFKGISENTLSLEAEPPRLLASNGSPGLWNNIQNRHAKASRALAQLVQKHLLDQAGSKKIRIQDAPLLVLEGADMPAILIEIGYLTNPAEEKALNDTGFLQNLAKGICNGIDNFFINLHE